MTLCMHLLIRHDVCTQLELELELELKRRLPCVLGGVNGQNN